MKTYIRYKPLVISIVFLIPEVAITAEAPAPAGNIVIFSSTHGFIDPASRSVTSTVESGSNIVEPTCNGVGDDGLSINAAIDRIRRQATRGEHSEQYGKLQLPAKECRIQTTINATGLRSASIIIDGGGGTILCFTKGQPCFDAMDSPRLVLRDLSLQGSVVATPSIGLQVGRPSPAGSASGMYLDHISINGQFQFAAFYNLNAETQLEIKLNASNNAPYGYGAVYDGINHWNARSSYVKVTEPIDLMQSFNDNTCVNCRITTAGIGGTPLWIAGTANLTFSNSYISNFKVGPGAVLYGFNTNPTFDAHFEASGLTSVFLFDGARNIVLYGLQFREHDFFAQNSLLATTPIVKSVRLENAELDLGRFHYPGRGGWFDDPKRYSLSGRVSGVDPGGWSKPGGGFSGTACFANLCTTY